jgi:predicted ATPase
MNTDRLIILTGPFGSGKSTLLQHLRVLGFQGIDEPARPILAEQKRIDGNGLPDKDARLFVDLMLSRMISDYHRMEIGSGPVFFDRGVPDMLGYAAAFGFDYPPGRNATCVYRYHRRVFFAPAWEQIYTTDEERTISYPVAKSFGDNLRDVYQQCRYELIDLPCVPVQDRAEFILSRL